MILTEDTMYKALLDRDPAYEGSFVVAVKTTGIFCRSTCTARKPRRNNVEFFPSCKEALQHGYRPCKICVPLKKYGETPETITGLLNQINNNPLSRINDTALRQRGIEPSSVRRWFKRHHRMTFHAYQRMMRLNTALTKIHLGGKITDAAFDAGYGSLSGFNDYFKSIVGGAPSKSKSKKLITIKRIETPIGPMYACATDEGICMLEFTDRRSLETEFKELVHYLDAVILPGEHRHIKKLQNELSEYFEGKRKAFSVPLNTPGTDFQKLVWQELQNIPFGKTVSYKRQAVALKRPRSVRAVANANGHNRISIVIPCHRVIGEDGTLTGYGGGLPRKKWLLEFEQRWKS
jgi:AraC family transcriptional regulator, regulatory protein of adaptative response / methylated-DNA-[protein]-cysteine methyltransferase